MTKGYIAVVADNPAHLAGRMTMIDAPALLAIGGRRLTNGAATALSEQDAIEIIER